MGNLILTRSHKARSPYFAEKLGINIYTGEELSYFIYNYYMLLDDDFLEDRLFHFIERELELSELAAKLKRWRGRVTYEELLLVILQDIHYYSSKELTEFYSRLESMSREGTETVIKEKADYLVNMGHSYEGLRLYDRLLAGKAEKNMPDSFAASVHYNMAVAHARIYNNYAAMQEYARAYRILANDDTLKHMFFITCLDKEVELPEDIKEELTREKEDEFLKEFEEIRNRALYSGKALEADSALELDDIKRPKRMEELLSEWKAEYIRRQG